MRYYNSKHLFKYANMYVCRALLKHGYSKFSLAILEYCEPEKCLERDNIILIFYNLNIIFCRQMGQVWVINTQNKHELK